MGHSRNSAARKNAAPRVERSASKVTAAPAEAVNGNELAVGSPDLRVAALLRERDQLLRKIAAKDRERGRLQQSSEELSRTLRSELPPIFARQQQISAELKKLFEELLSRQLSRSARRSVRSVFDSLRGSGFIADDLDEELDDEAEEAFQHAQRTGRGRADRDEREHQSASHGGSWAHAEHNAKGGSGVQSGDALRSNFRRIAAALHPDRVQSEAAKRARTELMKALTHAYEAGDLAGLLQIEERWLSSEGAKEQADGDSGPQSGSADVGAWGAARVRGLERLVADLGSQLRAVNAEIRNLRRESPLADLTGVRPRSRAHQAELLADFVGRANSELKLAERMLTFVQSFAVGEISLVEFMAGPPRVGRDSDVEDLVDLLMGELDDLESQAPRRGRRSRR